MKNIFLASVLAFLPTYAIAHGDHPPRVAPCISKECTQEQVEQAVPLSIEMLVKAGKIDSAWTSAKVEKVEKKQFKKASEWVATVFNEKQKDLSKQRLYIFITTKGYLNGSNYTGE